MNLRTRDMRRAAALVLDAVPAVLEHLDQEVLERPDHGSPWELACRALHVANEAWQAAQLAAPESKRKPLRRKPKSKEKRQATADVRAQVLARALGQCECGCGRPFVLGGPELDHFFGRARAESVQSCWALRSDCHHRKTTATPSAEAWFERFRAHCIRYSYWAEAKRAASRLAYVEAKKRLGERLNQFTPRGQRHG